jgi:repressor LexA
MSAEVLPMTEKQQELFVLIRDRIDSCGRSPKVRELADALGIRPSTVSERIDTLVRKGWLRRTPNKTQSLRVAETTVVSTEYLNELHREIARLKADWRFK